MNRPRPHQLIQVPRPRRYRPRHPAGALVRRTTAEAPGTAASRRSPTTPTPPAPARRRRRFRTPRALREDAFWTGALTAMCIGGLLMAIIVTS